MSRFVRLLRRPLLATLATLLLTSQLAQAAPSHSLKAPRPLVWADFLGLNAQLHWF